MPNKVLSYQEALNINVLWQSPVPAAAIQLACDLTQDASVKPAEVELDKYLCDQNLSKNVLKLGHTSVFEHAVISFLISGISRSFLAQITRHRVASYTSGSQHYQDYRDYDAIGHNDVVNLDPFIRAMETAYECYAELIDDHGVLPEEARQVLPNAAAVNLMVTLNARSLINLINLRICKRNVKETQLFTARLLNLARAWFPQLFNHVHADCVVKGKCTQGRMSCGTTFHGQETKNV